ncbi:MAG: hypothetical protein H0X39_00440 [Actinobacteria bacterium]|nr:hypothetical protein [Actinomycetota bacterium]
MTPLQALANRTKHLLAMLTARLGVHVLANFLWVTASATAGSPSWYVNNAGRLVTFRTSPFMWCPLDPFLINGCTIAEARVRVIPGAARTGTNRITLQLVKRQVFATGTDWAPVGASGVFDDGTTSEQTIALTAIGEVVDLTQWSYALRVIGGNDANTNLDLFNGGSVTLA